MHMQQAWINIFHYTELHFSSTLRPLPPPQHSFTLHSVVAMESLSSGLGPYQSLLSNSQQPTATSRRPFREFFFQQAEVSVCLSTCKGTCLYTFVIEALSFY